jgi:hypothetical protein
MAAYDASVKKALSASQRSRRQCRTLVEPLQFDMLRHGVDLLALGL